MLTEYRNTLIIGIIICILLMGGCGPRTPEETFILAQKTLNELDGYSAALTYRIVDGEEVREYSFKQWVSMPSSFKIELIEPPELLGKTILSDGKNILINHDKLEDSVKFEMESLEQQRPLFIGDFLNTYWLSHDVEKRIEIEDGLEYVVLSCPSRGINVSMDKQELWLRSPKMIPLKMVVYEGTNLSSLITFEEFNPDWEPDEEFFKIEE